MNPATISLFCARCNQLHDFVVVVDENGDFMATCSNSIVTGQDENGGDIIKPCGHSLKFPGTGDLSALVASHNEENQPRVLADASGNIIPTSEQQAQIDAAAQAGQGE